MARRILIAGASSGIGLACAREAGREGHALALLARRDALLEGIAASLPGGTGRHAVVAADVLDPATVERALDAAEAKIGPLDTLVYSAGSALFLPVDQTTDAVWNEMLGANLTGLFHVVRALLPRLRRLGQGRIVALLSIASRQAFPGSAAYTAAKYGALGFVESLRAEVRGEGIHVTAVLPGATDTPLWDRLGPQWDRTRMMQPEQVARLICAALRDEGGGMVEEIRIGPVAGAL